MLLALAQHPELWDAPGQTLRTTHPGTPHSQVSDVWIRFNDLAGYNAGTPGAIVDEHESIWYPAAQVLPVKPLIFALMAQVHGERLGRVLLTRLPGGSAIAEHVDGGSHAAYYQRYHVSLQCPREALFFCAGEVVWMAPGSVYWFNNALPHRVQNAGHEDRITMIVDIAHGG
jgi:hypothetical protein